MAEICFIQESGKFVGYMKIRQQSVMSWKKKGREKAGEAYEQNYFFEMNVEQLKNEC